MKPPPGPGEPGDPVVVMWRLNVRASLRQRRLHACGCARLALTRTAARRWLPLVVVAEEYADGAGGPARLVEAAGRGQTLPQPRGAWGDARLMLDLDDALAAQWDQVAEEQTEYAPDHRLYRRVRFRAAVLADIVGPEVPPAFLPAWRTSTVTALAAQMYEARDFCTMPILADALQDAGCDNDDILDHCRDSQQVHVRGCWVTDLVLGKS